jgi:hypothetical protein
MPEVKLGHYRSNFEVEAFITKADWRRGREGPETAVRTRIELRD